MNHSTLGGAAAIFAFSFATTACSTAPTIPAPRLATATVGDSSSSPCRVTGRPVVLAKRVFAPGGVEVLVRDAGFEVRFAAAPSRCSAIAWPSFEARDGAPCPTAHAEAATNVDTDVATGTVPDSRTADAARFVLGVVAFESPESYAGFPHEITGADSAGSFRAPLGGPGGGDAIGLVPIAGERFLLLDVVGGRIDGSHQSSQLRAQPIASWGEAIGRAMRLSPPEASVLGHASAGTQPTGEGLVGYVASIDDEVDVLATPFACAVR